MIDDDSHFYVFLFLESKASYSRLIQSDPTGLMKDDAHALQIVEIVRMNAVKRNSNCRLEVT